MTGRISLHYEDEDCDEVIEQSFDSDCRAQDSRSADVTTTNGGGMKVELHLGDCLEVMAELPENSVDTIITDPPYGLTFMGKDWDRGVPGVKFWQEALRVAKPGAMLLAMGGTRTFHRLVVAIEDAGWEVRDSMAWLYGSGFPKSYDISKGIDKQSGAEREVIGIREDYAARACKNNFEQFTAINPSEKGINSKEFQQHMGEITAPSTPAAKLWHGWGTALKPAMELICVAMKPIDGTFVNNALTWGVAGLWIDGGRVYRDPDDASGWSVTGSKESENRAMSGKNYDREAKPDNPQGRFPANVITDGSDEVTGLFPQTTSGNLNSGHKRGDGTGNSFMGGGGVVQGNYGGDSGSAARFFYCAKASRSERNAGLEGMEERWIDESRKEGAVGGNNPRNRGARSATNHHPTVKPLALMRYLARLTKTPTGGVVLDPFMGSGTTGIACVLEGRKFIGIEIDEGYFDIACKRISDALKQPLLPFTEGKDDRQN